MSFYRKFERDCPQAWWQIQRAETSQRDERWIERGIEGQPKSRFAHDNRRTLILTGPKSAVKMSKGQIVTCSDDDGL
jgi:glycine cleavage system aminomethyltransferase T